MLTKERIGHLVEELTRDNLVALLRCEAGRQFQGERYAVGRIRELGLIEKGAWRCTEDGRQVVGELVGIPYTPRTSVPSFKTGNRASTTTMREGICVTCKERIPEGEVCIWVEGEGIYHPGCASPAN